MATRTREQLNRFDTATTDLVNKRWQEQEATHPVLFNRLREIAGVPQIKRGRWPDKQTKE